MAVETEVHLHSRQQRLLSDQQGRQQALDIGRSVCVTAPAGSGKTELLTQRLLALLAVVDTPEQILAMTFTRKAAAEMHERIVGALTNAVSDTPPQLDHQRQTWQLARAALARDTALGWRILANPARLRIQTIDSFCQRIAADAPVLSQFGVRPAAIDNADTLYEQAVDSYFQSLEQGDQAADDLAQLLLHVDNHVGRLRNLLIALLASREQWLDYVIEFEKTGQSSDILQQMLQRWIEEELQRCRDALAPYASELALAADFAGSHVDLNRDSERPTPVLSTLAGIVDLPMAEHAAFESWQTLLQLLLKKDGLVRQRLTKNEGFPPKTAASDKQQAAFFEQRKQQAQQLLKAIASDTNAVDTLAIAHGLPFDGYADDHWRILAPLCRSLMRAVAHLKVVFGVTGSCDHSQIALSALSVLRAECDAEASSVLWGEKLQHILVDEFQDTSIVQHRLLEHLTADWAQGNAVDARQQPKTLFVVGDGMQSIYGFRAAKVGLFLGLRAGGLGELAMHSVELSKNFRSTPAIVDWNNATFGEAFPVSTDVSRGAVPYHAAVSALDDDHDSSVDLTMFADDDSDDAAPAAIVQRLVDLRERYPDDSIAVLVRYRTHLRELLPALDATDLIWRGVDLDPLRKRECVVDCLSLTRAMLNPADMIAWAAVLRAPWCGLRLTDLQALSTAPVFGESSTVPSLRPVIAAMLESQPGTPLHLLQAVDGLSVDGRERLLALANAVQRAWHERGTKPLRHWLEGLWRELGGEWLAANGQIGDDRASAIAYFELVDRIDGTNDGAGGFSLDRLEREIESLYAAPGAHVSAVSDTAIQIMTIHKSKGLEFDHVLLPELQRRSPSDSKPLLLWNEHLYEDGYSKGLVLCPLQEAAKRIESGNKQRDSALFEFLRAEQQRVQRLENTRLLYVAATRAKKNLSVYARLSFDDEDKVKPPAAASLLHAIWPTTASQFMLADSAHDRSSDGAGDSVVDEEPTVKLARFDSASVARLHDVAGEASSQMKPSASTLLGSRPDLEETPATVSAGDVDLVGEAADTQRAIGLCVHELLQHIAERTVLVDGEKRDALPRAAVVARLKQLGLTDAALTDASNIVIRAIECTLQSDSGQWLLGEHPQARCEWSLVTKGDRGDEYHVLDRSFVDSNNIRWIIDYKTTHPLDGEPATAFLQRQTVLHRPQLQRYAIAVSALEQREQRLALFFPLIGRLHEVP